MKKIMLFFVLVGGVVEAMSLYKYYEKESNYLDVQKISVVSNEIRMQIFEEVQNKIHLSSPFQFNNLYKLESIVDITAFEGDCKVLCTAIKQMEFSTIVQIAQEVESLYKRSLLQDDYSKIFIQEQIMVTFINRLNRVYALPEIPLVDPCLYDYDRGKFCDITRNIRLYFLFKMTDLKKRCEDIETVLSNLDCIKKFNQNMHGNSSYLQYKMPEIASRISTFEFGRYNSTVNNYIAYYIINYPIIKNKFAQIIKSKLHDAGDIARKNALTIKIFSPSRSSYLSLSETTRPLIDWVFDSSVEFPKNSVDIEFNWSTIAACVNKVLSEAETITVLSEFVMPYCQQLFDEACKSPKYSSYKDSFIKEWELKERPRLHMIIDFIQDRVLPQKCQ